LVINIYLDYQSSLQITYTLKCSESTIFSYWRIWGREHCAFRKLWRVFYLQWRWK